jgi:hypothetical protein
MTKNKQDIYQQLQQSFPKEAYGQDKSRGFSLTTIDAYHIIDRLNQIFGLCGEGWKFEPIRWIETETEIVVIGNLCYDLDGDNTKKVPCVGGKRIVKNNLADAYKSAMTNAISKGASFLGVGIDVYMGSFAGQTTGSTTTSEPRKQTNTPKPDTSTPPEDMTQEEQYHDRIATIRSFATQKKLKATEVRAIEQEAKKFYKTDPSKGIEYLNEQIVATENK